MVNLQDLTKIYTGRNGNVVALEEASLHLEPEDFVAVQGASGSGKTTLLLMCGGLLAPDRGSVEFNGKDIYAMPGEERARYRAGNIGFVFQQFHLVPYLSVLENVMLPGTGNMVPHTRQRAKDLINKFNLTHRSDHVPAELSTGERQRTALARALINDPALLLADEPTGNLDRDNADVVISVFDEFAASGGMVMMVTHDDQVAARSPRIVRLAEGRIIHTNEDI